LVRGFRLSALNALASDKISKLAKSKDGKAEIVVEKVEPCVLVFFFKKRFQVFIPKKSVEYFIGDYMKDENLNPEIDYKLEVLE
jgi:hypothetical protein